MAPRIQLLFALLLSFLAACTSDAGFRAGSTLRSVDNDAFDRSDDQYTAGIALSHVTGPISSFEEGPLPTRLSRFLESRWPQTETDQRFVILSVAQRLFTPTDLSARDVIEDDLPYSALLYGTATVASQSRDQLNALSLSLGVVGPLALGEAVQTTIHDLIDSEEPEGWDNQLRNELLVNLGFDHRRRLIRFGKRTGLGGDLLGSVSGSVGNLQTQASLGATVRAGYRVPTNFHMQTPFLAEESLGLRPYDPLREDWSVYVFAGTVVTALANAIYLDGNTFTDSHSVDHDHAVGRASVGFAVRYSKLLAAVSFETATVPWDHPDGLEYENYGRIGLSWDF